MPRIISQANAYSEFMGRRDLSRYDPGARESIKVSTNIRGITLDVQSDSGGHKVYLVTEKNKAIGIISFERTWCDCYSPSSFILKKYRGLGYAKSVYQWVLDAGRTLVSDDSQSRLSSKLWRKLAESYELLVLDLPEDSVMYQGEVAKRYMTIPYMTNVLLGKGVSSEHFACAFGFELA